MLLRRPIAAHSIAAWFVNFFGVNMYFCILQLAGRLLLGVLQSGAVYLSVVDSCFAFYFFGQLLVYMLSAAAYLLVAANSCFLLTSAFPLHECE